LGNWAMMPAASMWDMSMTSAWKVAGDDVGHPPALQSCDRFLGRGA